MCPSNFFRSLLLTTGAVLLSGFASAGNGIRIPARFTALAVNMSGMGRTATMDVTVTRWSNAGEIEQLASAFNERGSAGLVRALDRLPRAGSFRVNSGLALDVHFVQRTPDPDDSGERILLVAERRIGFAETFNMTRSAEYPLSVIELRMNGDGEGTGTMWPVARINYWDVKEQLVIVDNYTMQPIQLTAVRLMKNRQA
jgi:hypothetical protein